MLPDALDLTHLVHLQTLTVSEFTDKRFTNSLPPNLLYLRIRSFLRDYLDLGALQSLKERIEDAHWQPKLTSLVIPAVHPANGPRYLELHSLLLNAAKQRGLRVEQRDMGWWREEVSKGWDSCR